jgi:hypothetical protein
MYRTPIAKIGSISSGIDEISVGTGGSGPEGGSGVQKIKIVYDVRDIRFQGLYHSLIGMP